MGVSFNMEKMLTFEFKRELRIFNYIDDKKYDLFYVERDSCEQLKAFFRELEEAERKIIAECDALKQAILRQAFNGEL